MRATGYRLRASGLDARAEARALRLPTEARALRLPAEAGSDGGIALVAALLVMVLLSALGLSLTMVTSTEERVSSSYAGASETFYAADAALALAIQELSLLPDWSPALDGSVSSSFVDRQAMTRPWPDGLAQTPSEATARVTCGQAACTGADMDARTADRPWGGNNPRWRLFAYGPLRNMSPAAAVNSSEYVAVWVGDDPSETDGNPLVDGDASAGPNPGQGRVSLLVHAYGPSSRRRVLGATIERGPSGVRLLSWQIR